MRLCLLRWLDERHLPWLKAHLSSPSQVSHQTFVFVSPSQIIMWQRSTLSSARNFSESPKKPEQQIRTLRERFGITLVICPPSMNGPPILYFCQAKDNTEMPCPCMAGSPLCYRRNRLCRAIGSLWCNFAPRPPRASSVYDGHVEHVVSGEAARFHSLEELLSLHGPSAGWRAGRVKRPGTSLARAPPRAPVAQRHTVVRRSRSRPSYETRRQPAEALACQGGLRMRGDRAAAHTRDAADGDDQRGLDGEMLRDQCQKLRCVHGQPWFDKDVEAGRMSRWWMSGDAS